MEFGGNNESRYSPDRECNNSGERHPEKCNFTITDTSGEHGKESFVFLFPSHSLPLSPSLPRTLTPFYSIAIRRKQTTKFIYLFLAKWKEKRLEMGRGGGEKKALEKILLRCFIMAAERFSERNRKPFFAFLFVVSEGG